MTTTPPSRLLNKPLNKQTNKGKQNGKAHKMTIKKVLQNIIHPYLTLFFFFLPTSFLFLLMLTICIFIIIHTHTHTHTHMHLHAFTCIFYKLIMQKYRHLVLMKSRPNRPIFATWPKYIFYHLHTIVNNNNYYL